LNWATYRDDRGVERFRYGAGEVREDEPVRSFTADINRVIERHAGRGRISYAAAIGVLFGVAGDLAREAREEVEKHE
jgi:Pyruvate/2-oxoacid:ferredoxin oxidoreductase gamma subunit